MVIRRKRGIIMTTIMVNGNEYELLEHMAEVKKTNNGFLFNRFYNKKQMFNYYKQKVEPNEEGRYGAPLVGSDCFENDNYIATIEICKLADIDFSRNDIESLEDDLEWGDDTFFVKDNDGTIYVVFTDVD
jgi:hypothetical protein